MHRTFLALFLIIITGCAYQFGYRERSLPGGYKQVAIPMFKNSTGIIGAESGFTNALRREFARSKVSRIVDVDNAPAIIEGNIEIINFKHEGQIVSDQERDVTTNRCKGDFPCYTVLTSEYRVFVSANLRLRRVSDNKLLWENKFTGERVYTAPQVGLPVVNTVNPLYNHSARFEIVEELAHDMMSEAHTRITENF